MAVDGIDTLIALAVVVRHQCQVLFQIASDPDGHLTTDFDEKFGSEFGPPDMTKKSGLDGP
ncbi:MAG: hypothetical protein ABSC41_05545 [Acidimicrobiales bacterium]